jgi:hypothetical protein
LPTGSSNRFSVMRLPLIPLISILGSLAVYGSPEPRFSDAPRLAPASDKLDALIGPIDTTITLGVWLKQHPDEALTDSAPNSDDHESQICAWTKSRLTIEGRRAVRWAQFNIPNPPPGETLPADGADVAARECRLRALWLQVAEPDSLRSHALARTIARIIDVKLGNSQPKLMIGAPGAANWLEPRTWQGPGTKVVLAIRELEYFRNPESYENDSSKIIYPRSVLVVAYAPFSGLDDTDDPNWDLWARHLDEDEAWERTWILDKIDSAIARVDITPIATDLRTVLKALRSSRMFDSIPPPTSAALVRAAGAIHDRAPALPPAQRAALLFAGDLVIQQAASALYTDTTKPAYRLYKALTAAGVEYGPETYMVGYPYTRAWLWEAYRLDSLGVTGHSALLELLAIGWHTSGACEENTGSIDRVIERSEAAMRGGNIDPVIQYHIGRAYSARYAVASARQLQYADTQYAAQAAEEARIRGIEWLRTSLLALKPPHLRRDAWRSAVRLMLHLPSDVRISCSME